MAVLACITCLSFGNGEDPDPGSCKDHGEVIGHGEVIRPSHDSGADAHRWARYPAPRSPSRRVVPATGALRVTAIAVMDRVAPSGPVDGSGSVHLYAARNE